MKSVVRCVLLLTAMASNAQTTPPPEMRHVANFAVDDTPRLAALARLGALTQTSILVEADTLPYLQAPISLFAQNSTVFSIVTEILRGAEAYRVRQQGSLLIIFSTHTRSRLLTLPLGPFSFTGKSLASLIPLLEFHVRRATGCNPQGYGWAGASMDLDMPPMNLSSADIEQIIARVAEAPQPTMWIIAPEPLPTGCVDDPGAHWEVGFYGFGARFSTCDMPLSTSTGPAFVTGPRPQTPPDTTCTQPKLPNPLPR